MGRKKRSKDPVRMGMVRLLTQHQQGVTKCNLLQEDIQKELSSQELLKDSSKEVECKNHSFRAYLVTIFQRS